MILGMSLPFVTLRLADGAENAFAIAVKDNGDPVDMTGYTVNLKIMSGSTVLHTFVGNIVGTNVVAWTISSGDALASYIGKTLRFDVVKDGNTYLWGKGKVVSA